MVRVLLVVVPLLIGWIAVRLASPYFFQPEGWIGFGFWMVQAITVAIATTAVTKQVADRFAPLSALLKLSLVFPDTAPSRFGLALRMGSTRSMKAKVVTTLDADVGVAARQAIELVVQLGHHERKTRGHVERVRAYGELVGAELGITGEELEKLRWGLLLHDVGKLQVPAEILSKDGKPTDQEWQILRRHPADGAAMLEPLRPWLGHWIDSAGSHHEKWSGDGYPAGLSGNQIPLAGRICAVADAYDVMTSKRSYKDAGSHDDAREELVRCAGTHFDPDVVRAMLRVGITRAKSTSMFGWLLEIRGVAEIAGQAAQLTVAPVAVTAGIVAGTAATLVTPGVLPESGPIPETIALVSEIPESTTTSKPVEEPAPSTTTSTPTVESEPTTSLALTETTAESTTTVSVAESSTSTTAAPATTAAAAAPTTTTAPATTVTTASTTTVASTTTTVPPTTTTTIATTTTTAGPWNPPGSNFVYLEAADAPPSLSPDEYEQHGKIFLIRESGPVTLGAPLDVTAPDQGEWQGLDGTDPTVQLGAGTVVCTWFLHFDPAPWDFNTGADGSLPSTILGFMATESQLTNTDSFAIPGLDYDYSEADGSDYVKISGANLEVSYSAFAGFADQTRFFTAC